MSKRNDNDAAAQPVVPWLVTVMVWLMRVVVGGTFVFSGMVKAIDPWGTYYKIQEYLLTWGWDSMVSFALVGAFALAVLETLLGVALLLGAYRRGAPIVAAVMLMVLTPITLWLAVTNAVPDCGCFGDALILSNWATFGKNVLLLLGVVFLFLFGRRVRGLYGPAVQWAVMALTFVLTMAIATVGYFTQPMIDFRPYPVGTVLQAPATVGEDDYTFVYEKDGEQQEFTIDEVPDDESGWNFVERRPAHRDSTASAVTPNIAITDQGSDVTDEILNDGNSQLLLLFPDLKDVSIAYTFNINELADYARRHGAAVYALTSASDGDIAEWADISMADYPLLVSDDSEIKMIARGNPAVVYVKDHTIKWKRTLGSISTDRIHDATLNLDTLSNDLDPHGSLRNWLWLYALAMLALLVINRAPQLLWNLLPRNRAKAKKAASAEGTEGEQAADEADEQPVASEEVPAGDSEEKQEKKEETKNQ